MILFSFPTLTSSFSIKSANYSNNSKIKATEYISVDKYENNSLIANVDIVYKTDPANNPTIFLQHELNFLNNISILSFKSFKNYLKFASIKSGDYNKIIIKPKTKTLVLEKPISVKLQLKINSYEKTKFYTSYLLPNLDKIQLNPDLVKSFKYGYLYFPLKDPSYSELIVFSKQGFVFNGLNVVTSIGDKLAYMPIILDGLFVIYLKSFVKYIFFFVLIVYNVLWLIPLLLRFKKKHSIRGISIFH